MAPVLFNGRFFGYYGDHKLIIDNNNLDNIGFEFCNIIIIINIIIVGSSIS